LNNETLDLLEARLLKGLLGKEDIPASVMEILRRVLVDNARLVIKPEQGDQAPYMDDLTEDDLGEMPNISVVK
jgi:hypothetical protein